MIWYVNGTFPIKQPKGLLIQGWHYLVSIARLWQGNLSDYKRRREVELKHGRVAMLLGCRNLWLEYETVHSGLMNVAGCVATGRTGRVYCIIVPFVSCCIILSYHSTGAALCWLRFFLVDHAGFALGFTLHLFRMGWWHIALWYPSNCWLVWTWFGYMFLTRSGCYSFHDNGSASQVWKRLRSL